ncbi:CAP domain-containing protein [Hymenobacter sp. 5516J-16]|uniref:CAP domain-containing protein n=1 Tax=Hymenobacter sp. 5516J-16 TaxID=2932253 RepID=UPI001FD1CE0F|nr:CAP domain-containing protein [Hymenobacter sp. 5516J-16]UOQ77775.1 CAP domain-containing protein [Hymenobacter sp. 5516J-16]
MNYVYVLLLTCFTSLSNVVGSGHRETAAPVQQWADVDTARELLRQCNAYRQRAGLPPLVLSETACRAARLQAIYNLTHRTHGHYHPLYPRRGSDWRLWGTDLRKPAAL